MRILIVEDDDYKRKNLKSMLEMIRGIDVKIITKKAITPALRYIYKNPEGIDGIILDLDLPRFESNNSFSKIIPMGGTYIPKEMTRLGIDIPILIYSFQAYIIDYNSYLDDFHNIKGKVDPSSSDAMINIHSFIESIENGEF